MLMLREQKGLGVIDTLVVCIVVALLMVVSLGYYHPIALEAQQTALRAGLRNIRVSVNLYRAFNHNQNPRHLKALITQRYLSSSPTGSIFEQSYLDAYSTDSEGYPTDPFGHRYRYEPRSGDVHSSTHGYETW